MLWAHNAHVQRAAISSPPAPVRPVPSMGVILADSLGPGYAAVGMSYTGASIDSASAPVAGSIDATLGQAGLAGMLVPLSSAPRSGPVARWLATPRLMRFQVGHLTVAPIPAFDAILFVDRARPADRAPATSP